MKHFSKYLVLVCFALLVCSCREQNRLGYASGLYRTENAESFKATKAAFASWLLAHGLTLSFPPDETSEWSGARPKDSQTTWYALPIGRNKLLLRVTANPQEMGIIAATDYNGDFTTAELAEMRVRNLQLWLDIIAWFEADAKENSMAGDAEKWFSGVKSDIHRTYSK